MTRGAYRTGAGSGMTTVPPRTWWAFAILALLLLIATMAWHLPMMLWDHVDLVPMYEAWRDGSLASSGFWQIHDGSHLHVSGYAVLLLTTAASGGQPWLDCLASVGLLVLQAWILMRSRALLAGRSAGCVLLALLWRRHPGICQIRGAGRWRVLARRGPVDAIALLTLRAVVAGTCWGAGGVAGGSRGFRHLTVFPIAMGMLALHTGLSGRSAGFRAASLAGAALSGGCGWDGAGPLRCAGSAHC